MNVIFIFALISARRAQAATPSAALIDESVASGAQREPCRCEMGRITWRGALRLHTGYETLPQPWSISSSHIPYGNCSSTSSGFSPAWSPLSTIY